jgi:hypothetical protein
MSSGRAARRRRRDARRRTIAGAVAFLIAIVIVPLLLVLDGGTPKRLDTDATKDDALSLVRAAIGHTVAAGSYEVDIETSSTQARTAPSQCGPSGCLAGAGNSQFTSGGHSIVNFEPSYVARNESQSTYGNHVFWVTPTRVWLLSTSGAPVMTPGQPLSQFARSIISALGPSPGALAALSLAVPGGQINLQEEAVATAAPSGEGEVKGTHVTYYDVTIDMTRLADVAGLSADQRATIDDALPFLRQGGYSGTTERIGVDDEGFVREVALTNHFSDGSTGTQHHVLSNFGCAPKLTPPDAGGTVTPVPCPPPTPASTTTTRPSSTSVPSSASPTTSSSTTAPTSTTGPTTTTSPVPSTTTSSRP